MADFLKIQGTTLDSFSIGLKTKKSTITVDGTSFTLDKQLDLNSHKIIRVTDPENDQDAATKNYVDDADALKMDLVGAAVEDNLASYDGAGQVKDSGVAITTDEPDVSSDDTTVPTSAAVFSAIETAVSAAVILQGNWDADTNTPDITGTTITGYAWVVSVAGDTDLGGITDWAVNDWAVKSATGWLKIANQDAAAVWGNITGDIDDQTDLQDEFDTKMDLVTGAVEDNLAIYDAAGQVVDALVAITTAVPSVASDDTTVPTSLAVYTADAALQDNIDDKMDLVPGATEDDFATFDDAGQAKDSGLSLTTTISSGSLNTEVPSALAVYNAIEANVPAGAVQKVKVTIAQANVSSTFKIPNGSVIQRVILVVSTPYTAGGVISAAVGAVSILGTTDNDAQTAGQYDDLNVKLATSEAVVAVTVGGAPGSGNATLYVDFVASPLV